MRRTFHDLVGGGENRPGCIYVVKRRRERDAEVEEMVYMVEATYPGTKAAEVANYFVERLKADPMPEYIKIRDLYAFAGGDGIEALLFYDIDDGKEKDATDWIGKAVVDFLQKIDGYKAQGRIAHTMEEAFQLIDMQAPAV